jgi:glycosyltransferase involved in cell wall biosynthesis
MGKKLSIITINYNNAGGLRKTIGSVLSQTFRAIEYIIIDGGSKDESVSVIKEYEDHLTYWVSEKDKGVYNAMNKGIVKATGEYLLFLNSGDVLAANDVLEKMLLQKNSHADILYGYMKRVFPDGRKELIRFPSKIDMGFLLHRTLGHPSTFFKKELFDKYGLYREDMKIAADWAFFVKAIGVGSATQQSKPMAVSVFAMDGISSNKDNALLTAKEKNMILAEFFSPDQLKAIKNDYRLKNRFTYFPDKLLRVFERAKSYINR